MNAIALSLQRIASSGQIDRAGWLLMHSLWQFTLIAAVAGVAGRMLRSHSAEVRYRVLLTAMLLMAVTPIGTCWLLPADRTAVTVQSGERNRNLGDSAVAVVVNPINAVSIDRQPMTSRGESHARLQKPDVSPAQTPSAGLPSVRPSDTWSAVAAESIAPWLSTLVGGWCCGVLLFLLRPLLSWRKVRQMSRTGISPPNEHVLQLMPDLQLRLGVRRRVQVLQSSLVGSPVVIGCFRSMILLPTCLITGMPSTQLQAILAHELAHVRRYDSLVNLLQTLVESLFFYHPAVWWVSQRLRIEREHCCDDLVVTVLGNRVEYGRALLAVEQLRAAPSLLALGTRDGSLLARIRRLLSPDHQTVPPVSSWTSLVVCGLVVAAILGGLSAAHGLTASDAGMDEQSGGLATTEPQVSQTPPKATDVLIISGDNDNLLISAAELNIKGLQDVNDPAILIDQLERGPRASQFLMTGGGIFWRPGTAPRPGSVKLWMRQFAVESGLDPRVKRLIQLGSPALTKVHQRLPGARPAVAGHLAMVLRSIGDETSIPLLIQLLDRLSQSDQQVTMETHALMATFAATSALWELTGQEHVFTPKEWQQWWEEAGDGYLVARRRTLSVLSEPQAAAVAATLIAELRRQELPARDRLIAQGPAMIPHLLTVLEREPVQPSPLQSPESPRSMAVRLAWVVDELGATQRLSADLRRIYFAERIATNWMQSRHVPADEAAVCRALSHCSFADFCRILIDAERMTNNQEPQQGGALRTWLSMNSILFSRRFGQDPKYVVNSTLHPLWNHVIPAENPAQQIADAVPVLLAALEDPQSTVRLRTAFLAAHIGFCSDQRPETLITALRDCWLSEPEENVRKQLGFAMARHSTPLVQKAFSDGLRSDRLEIVRDAAQLFDWIDVALTNETRTDFELLKQFTQSDDDLLRSYAVRSLASKAPEFLMSELDRLRHDTNDSIRERLIRIRMANPSAEFIDALFELTHDSSESIRTEAISAIGRLHRPELMMRLQPLLRDAGVHGWAASAIVDSGGVQALPILMEELNSGNDVGGMIYQHLKRLSGQSFANRPELWLAWWQQQTDQDAPGNEDAQKDADVQTESDAQKNAERVAPEEQADTRFPWRAHGRVVDGMGIPLEGAVVRAATGIGSLRGGSRAVTDQDGRYDFQFGRGIVIGSDEDGTPSPQTQYALISVQRDGYFETNFCRHGNGIASLQPVDAATAKMWGVDPEQVCVPGKPRQVDFVMLPAAKVSGILVGKDNKPLKDYSVSLTGEELSPGSSVLAQVSSDAEGKFRITEIPTTMPYQFVIRKPRSELQWPWNDSWASGPILFTNPGDHDFSATVQQQRPESTVVIENLTLQIVGPGVHGKTAVAAAARKSPLAEFQLDRPELRIDGEVQLQLKELTLMLENPGDLPNRNDNERESNR